MSHQPGFSLLELLVTVMVVAVTLGLGVPLFTQTVESSRLSAETNAFVRGVHLAKIEAAKHFRDVVICPSQDGADCSDDLAAWQAGWLIFVNLDQDVPPDVDDNEHVIAARVTAKNIRVVANRKAFVFRNYARRSTNGTLIFCAASHDDRARAVVVSYTGRPRVARTRSNGRRYTCNH